MMQDLRYGFRALRRRKAFTLVAALSLALGIGANTAIFSVVDSVLLRPLPYPGAERLVRINAAELKQRDQWEGWNRVGVSLADFRQWQSQSQSYEEMALCTGSGGYKTGEAEQRYLVGSRVSLNLFSMLGAEPALGRSFKPENEQPDGERVVILSHDFWEERYQADPNALGQKITINNQPHTIVGVMPASFRDYFARGFWDNRERFGSLQVEAPTRTQIWLPLSITDEAATWHGRGGNRHGAYQVLARLKPGVTRQQAQTELSALTAQIAERFPESNHDLGAAVFSLHEEVTGSSQRKMLLLAAAFSLVLLIACANVASLLLARGIERAKELAIRATLGAGFWRVLRQLLTECLLLAGLGGGLGMLLAYGMVIGIKPLIPADVPRGDAVTLDSRALLFTLGLTVLTTLLFGLLPAWQATRLNLTEELKDAGRSVTESRLSRRWRHALIVGQVALTMILLTGAGLAARSFWRVYAADLGYDTDKLVRLRIASPRPFNRERQMRFAPNAEDAAELDQYWQPLLARVRSLPGVADAAFAGGSPLQGTGFGVQMRIPGHVPANPKLQPLIHGDIVSHDYFRLLGIKLLQGRDFNDGDRPDAPLAVIVNETFARTYFPQQQAVGQTLMIHSGPEIETPANIVGVVTDVRARLDRPIEPLYYQTLEQSPLRGMSLLVRATGDPSALTASLRDVVRSFKPASPLPPSLDKPVAVNEIWAGFTVKPRFYLSLLGGLAALALLLAATGIYGTLFLAINQRTHEIGIRRALGAQDRDVLLPALRQGVLLALTGMGIGLLGAWALTRFIRGWLVEISPTDPPAFAMAAALLLLVTLAACYAPARRAVKVDPLRSLRHE